MSPSIRSLAAAGDILGLERFDEDDLYANLDWLSAFGYNRDGKRGKMQIVIGLLCNGAGVPLSIEVFPGNTQDPKTVAAQVRKVAALRGLVKKQNTYLVEHPGATPAW